jgi:signal transduction histidine kinase
MGHELKKPATALSGYLELMEEDVGEGMEQRLPELIGKARRECDLLNEVNSFFLKLLRVDPRSEVHEVTRVQLPDFVNDIVNRMPDNLQAPKRVRVELAPALRDCYANPNALSTILRNVIENALTYSPAASKVFVELEKTADKRSPGNEEILKIKVTDHGEGIPSEHLRRIFSPFVRLNEDKTEGSGLGLTLVRSLVELHGGNVHVRSEKGDGTTVFVILPQNDQCDEDMVRE